MRKRGLLLDRDGVINIDHGYVGSKAAFTFISGLFPFLRSVRDLGFRLAILTNQSGVGRGLYTKTAFEELNLWMLGELGREGIEIDLVLASFEHPEAKDPLYKRESYWRKPKPGMVLDALQRLKLDPLRSAFLGDKVHDMEAAYAGGIKTCLLLSGKGEVPAYAKAVKDYDEALLLLKSSSL